VTQQPIGTLSAFFYGILLLVGLLYHVMPALTRREIFFGVTVPAGFRNSTDGRRILGRYRVQMWLATLLALACVTAGIFMGRFVLTLASVYWQVIGAFLAFQHARHGTQPHAVAPSTESEARLAPRRSPIPGAQLLHVGPIALLVASALRLRAHWSEIPERFVRHWDIAGNPNGWSTRTFFGVYGSLLIGAAMCIMMIALWYVILYGTRQISASGRSAQSEDRFRTTQLIILMSAEYLIGFMFSWVSQLPLGSGAFLPRESFAFFMIGMLVYIAGIILVLVFTGQGGSRLGGDVLALQTEAGGAPVGDRTPDQCWKLGLIYVNRADPSLFVEKRFGIGYTINLGHPLTWVLLCVILLPALASIVISRFMH
jgi:uncharacterized membrane protein